MLGGPCPPSARSRGRDGRRFGGHRTDHAVIGAGPARRAPGAHRDQGARRRRGAVLRAAAAVAGAGRRPPPGRRHRRAHRADRLRHRAHLPLQPHHQLRPGDLGGRPGVARPCCSSSAPGCPTSSPCRSASSPPSSSARSSSSLIIRRFFKAPRLILTVVTIGVVAAARRRRASCPSAVRHQRRRRRSFPSPFDFTLRDRPRPCSAATTSSPCSPCRSCIAALGAFFRYTSIGIAVRASAESADRAALLGVPVKRIQTIVWVVATVLAVRRPSSCGPASSACPIGSVLGPDASSSGRSPPRVIGRMERLPTIFVASLGLGVAREQRSCSAPATAVLVDPILFVVVLVALLLQRAQTPLAWRRRAVDVAGRHATCGRSPRAGRRSPEVALGRALGAGAAASLFAARPPAAARRGRDQPRRVIVIFASSALARRAHRLGRPGEPRPDRVHRHRRRRRRLRSPPTLGWDLSLAIARSPGSPARSRPWSSAARRCASAACSSPSSTLAFALATSSYLLNAAATSTGCPTGRIERPPLFGRIVARHARPATTTSASPACWSPSPLVRGLRRSRTGRVLIGVRENERAAQAYGVNVTSAKLTAFAVSGFLAAFAGALFVHHQQALGIQPYCRRREPRRSSSWSSSAASVDPRGAPRRGLHPGHRLLPDAVPGGDPAATCSSSPAASACSSCCWSCPAGSARSCYDLRDRCLRVGRRPARHHRAEPRRRPPRDRRRTGGRHAAADRS